MIYGIGTDIIEVERIKNQLSKNEGLKETLFTPHEIEYCESQKQNEQNYAARYTAKEAFFKALGTGWRYGMQYQNIEIRNDKLGKPEIFLSGKAKDFATKNSFKNIHVSFSHLKEIVNAIVIIEK